MKKSQKVEWRTFNLKKLSDELKKLKKEAIDAVLEKKIGKLANVAYPRQKRKEIASLLTIISEKKFLENLEKGKALEKEGDKNGKDK
jgi:ribosomal protein L29